MKHYSLAVSIALLGFEFSGVGQEFQAPVFNRVWDASFGGSGEDVFPDALNAIKATLDGGYVLAAASASSETGNKMTAGYGATDFWILKLDKRGNRMWEQTYGGSGSEGLQHILVTTDGGYLLVGESNSRSDGNKTAPNRGGIDAWLVKIVSVKGSTSSGRAAASARLTA